jgi:hypothetical protein
VSALLREWAWPALALAPLVLTAVVSQRAGLATVLVAAGAALLWPVLAARHSRGVALAALVALVYGTVAAGLALDDSPSEPWLLYPDSPAVQAFAAARAFAVAAVLVRLAWGRGIADLRPTVLVVLSIVVIALTGPMGSSLGLVVLTVVLQHARIARPLSIVWIVSLAIATVVLAANDAGPEAVLDGLFSSWRGLMFSSPVLWLGIAGCLRERRAGPSAALGPALLVAAAVGAVTSDFGPYRGVRFAPVLPLLGLGLARAFDGIRSFALHRPLVPIAAGVAALAAWNALLMGQYRDGRIPRDDTVSFPRIARNAAATISAAVGSPTAWPANWIFAARHDVSAARYDLLAGVDLFGPVAHGSAFRPWPPGRQGVIDVGHLPTDEALLQRGWSVRHPCGAGVCRAVEGTAELLAPIGEPRDLQVMLVAEGAGTLTMAVNGVPVLAAPLAYDDDKAHFARLPRARFRRGLNAVVFTIPPGGQALVDRIVFTIVDGPA